MLNKYFDIYCLCLSKKCFYSTIALSIIIFVIFFLFFFWAKSANINKKYYIVL